MIATSFMKASFGVDRCPDMGHVFTPRSRECKWLAMQNDHAPVVISSGEALATRRRMLPTWTLWQLAACAAASVAFVPASGPRERIAFAFALLGARGFVVIFDALRRPQAILAKRYAAA